MDQEEEVTMEDIQGYKLLAALSCNEEELNEISKGDKLLEKFKGEVIRLNKDRKFANFMDQEEEARKLHNTLIIEATMKGIEQGEQNSKVNIAKNMIKKGTDSKFIAEVTGLSLEDIKKLKA